MSEPKAYLRAGEAAELLYVTSRTVWRWAELGLLPYTRTLHGHRRYKRADVLALRDRLNPPDELVELLSGSNEEAS
jgi:excisionase family DNA binding protein